MAEKRFESAPWWWFGLEDDGTYTQMDRERGRREHLLFSEAREESRNRVDEYMASIRREG